MGLSRPRLARYRLLVKHSLTPPSTLDDVTSALDVAAEVLELEGEMDTYKLEKLVYYCQAWHLAWFEKPLFGEPVRAWKQGPVVRELWNEHAHQYRVARIRGGDPTRLTDEQRLAIRAVLQRYARFSGTQLSEMTHQEPPWQVTRDGLKPTEGSDRIISNHLIGSYFRDWGGLIASMDYSDEPPVEVAKRVADDDDDALLDFLTSGG